MNNIYDTIKGHIFSFEVMYGYKPNTIILGKLTYKRLITFVDTHNLNIELCHRIDECDIIVRHSVDDYIYIEKRAEDKLVKYNTEIKSEEYNAEDYDTNMNAYQRRKDKQKKKYIKWLLKGEEVAVKPLSKSKEKKIDNDLQYMHNEFKFQKWLEDNNRL